MIPETQRLSERLGVGFPLGLRQHDLRLDADAGVNLVVAEEDLRRGSAGSAVLGHVVSTDVDCGGAAPFHMVVTLGFTVYMT